MKTFWNFRWKCSPFVAKVKQDYRGENIILLSFISVIEANVFGRFVLFCKRILVKFTFFHLLYLTEAVTFTSEKRNVTELL